MNKANTCDVCGQPVDPPMLRCDSCIENANSEPKNHDLLPIIPGTDFNDGDE